MSLVCRWPVRICFTSVETFLLSLCLMQVGTEETEPSTPLVLVKGHLFKDAHGAGCITQTPARFSLWLI